jgi:peptide/nickel transport system permease protein
LFGFLLIILIVFVSVLDVAVPALSKVVLGHPIQLTGYSPYDLSSQYHEAPSWQHWFGTDELGRDMFARVMAALPLDLSVGLLVAGSGVVLGSLLGVIAGFWDEPRTVRGGLSTLILRVTDVFLAFPALVLALAIIASLGRGLVTAVIALIVTWWPYYVRLARGEVITLKHRGFVTAARAGGIRDIHIVTRHIIPNLLPTLLIYLTMDIGSVVLSFSALSFLGIGAPPSVPELGAMVFFYEPFLLEYPWMVLAPGLMVIIVVLALSALGDGLGTALDPRSRSLFAVRVLARAATAREERVPPA